MNYHVLRSMLLAGYFIAAAAGAIANSPETPADTKPPSISIELGMSDFRNYCAACHGLTGVGDGTVAEFMTIAAAALTQLSWKNASMFPRQKVIGVIDGCAEVRVHGLRDMPVWGDWFGAEAVGPGMDAATRDEVVRVRINTLAGYIETLQVK